MPDESIAPETEQARPAVNSELKNAKDISSTDHNKKNSQAQSEDDIEVSDVDSDLEPEQLQTIYLRSKEKLFEVRPDLTDAKIDKQTKTKPKQTGSTKGDSFPPGIAKLINRIRNIEGDVLFEREEAEAKWKVRRDLLAAERSLNRRQHKPRFNPSSPGKRVKENVERQQKGEELMTFKDLDGSNEDDSDDEQTFADLFEELQTKHEKKKSEIPEQDADNSAITIRSFAQYKGVEPRRVLEDVCKSRYAILHCLPPGFDSDANIDAGTLTLKSHTKKCPHPLSQTVTL